MRVLLISYYYPPDGAVGALRPAKVVDAFRRAGHDVTIVAAGDADAPIDVHGVARVRPCSSPRDWYLRLKHRNDIAIPGEVTAAARAGSSAAGFAPPERVPTWKRYVTSLLWLPDDRQGFIPSAYRLALRMHESRPFDLIYTSAPPFSTHVAGLALASSIEVRWVVEYRDPWMDGPGKPAFVRSAVVDAAEERIERRCLTSAAEVVVVTAATGKALGRRLRLLGRRAPILARNGIDRFDSQLEPRVGPVRIMYVGNLYLSRDPRPFLVALAQLRTRAQLPPEGIAIDFIGDCRWFFNESVDEMARELGLADVLRFRDRIPHRQVASAMRDADVLLLLAQGQPLQVPNKLYEYLGTRKSILAFADADGETTAMLREVGGHAVVTEHDADNAMDIVRQALLESRCPPTSDQRVLLGWSAEKQMDELVRHLEREP